MVDAVSMLSGMMMDERADADGAEPEYRMYKCRDAGQLMPMHIRTNTYEHEFGCHVCNGLTN